MGQTHSPHCISPGSMLQCCSEMWELLQTDTNGDSCPGREKICIESRQSFGSDIKNNPRRERAVHCSLHAAPAGCSLDAAVIHTAGIIVLCRRPSSAWPGNVSTRLPRCRWTLLNLLISDDLDKKKTQSFKKEDPVLYNTRIISYNLSKVYCLLRSASKKIKSTDNRS